MKPPAGRCPVFIAAGFDWIFPCIFTFLQSDQEICEQFHRLKIGSVRYSAEAATSDDTGTDDSEHDGLLKMSDF
jgi:hypothetical protein